MSPSPHSQTAAAAASANWPLCVTGNTLLATALLGSMVFLLGRRKSTGSAASSTSKPGAQAVELDEQPGVFKSALLKEERDVHTKGTYFPDVLTLFDAFQHGLKISANEPCLGWRPSKEAAYEFISYSDVQSRSQALGAMLLSQMGLRPGNSSFVAIYARNCPEWTISALACVRHSMIVVPLYDTLGADAAAFILKHTEAELVVVDDVPKLNNVLSMKQSTPALKHIILVDRPSDEAQMAALEQRALEAGVRVHVWDALMEAAKQASAVEDHPPTAEDTYIVCYTSGTTGTPKGVVLSHANVMANLSAMAHLFERYLPELLHADGSMISYLPLSHMFEQCCHWAGLLLGYRIGFFSGDIATLSSDMQALQPTVFPVVPRLLNRFNDTLKSQVARSGALKRWLFSLAHAQKLALLRKGVVTNQTVWDKLVFVKAQEQLGGKVRLIITGSAPIAAEVLQDLRIAFGTTIVEGYGQTECTAMVTCTLPGDVEGGHCGPPAVCSLLKLADVPDLNYFAKDRKGEVMVKGPMVTKGYYRDAEKTAELFDADGFLHTGDIGHILADGRLKIIDRKKHIFKLAQGEYVAPEKIESVYVQCPLVQQVYVDGDSLQRYLVAVIVPPEKALRRLYAEQTAQANGGGTAAEEPIEAKPFAEICADKRMVAAVLDQMRQMGKAHNLNSIEQVKLVHLEPELFSVENGLLTPTLKSKRPQLRLKYKETMARLYEEGGENGTGR